MQPFVAAMMVNLSSPLERALAKLEKAVRPDSDAIMVATG
jgi:hypothetical protein